MPVFMFLQMLIMDVEDTQRFEAKWLQDALGASDKRVASTT